MPASTYLEAVRNRVVIFDGAAGTWLQLQDLTIEDYGTPELEGCPEILNETRPELIRQMHSEYLEAGADVVETNTFGGMRADTRRVRTRGPHRGAQRDGRPHRPRGGG